MECSAEMKILSDVTQSEWSWEFDCVLRWMLASSVLFGATRVQLFKHAGNANLDLDLDTLSGSNGMLCPHPMNFIVTQRNAILHLRLRICNTC